MAKGTEIQLDAAMALESIFELRDDFDDGVPRVLDVRIGRQLQMAQPEDIRRTIQKYAEDLNDFGVLAQRAKTPGALGGRPTKEYWLNKDQALFIAGRSDTELGRKTYKLLVKVFGEFMREAQARVPPILQDHFRPWEKTWKDDIARLLCSLQGEQFKGRHPRWAARHYAEIYKCLLGEAAYAELKRINPSPAKGHNHHQLIRGELVESFKRRLTIVEALLEVSESLPDFQAKMRRAFLKSPLQLTLLPRESRKPVRT